MTTRRPSLASARRPSSAIFIGLPPPPSPPSPAPSSSSTRSQLPSPPATNSGSTGDSNSTSAGSLRRAGMPNGNKNTLLTDDDDNVPDHDEDDTARLSNDRLLGGAKDADLNLSSSTLQRVKSLTERNRQVIHKLSSITSPDSHSRSSLSTPSAPSSSRSRSPLPPAFSSSSSSSTASASSRVSFSVSPRGGSGSETEREQRPERVRPPSRDINPPSTDDNNTTTPSASIRQRTPVFEPNEPRQRLRSAPSSPAKLPVALTPNTPRKHTSTVFAVIGSGRRSRRVSIQQPDAEDDSPPEPSQTTGGSGNRRARAPLPREFRDGRSLDGRSVGEGSTSTQQTHDHERTISPGVLVARGAASPQSSGAGGTFSATPTSPRAQRPARPSTMRDSRRVQRWNSVDEVALNGSGSSPLADDPEGRRQWRHAGSADSPLGGREGRSVVGEGLRAAGLAPRGSEDVFADGVPPRRTRLSGGLGGRPSLNGTRDGDLDELRRGIARVGLGLRDEERDQRDSRDPRDPRTPPSASGSGRYGTARNIHSVLSGSTSSRAGTSLGSYGADEEGPRTAPLRSYRSSFVLPDRSASRHTPQHERSHTSPSYGRATPHLQTPSSEHARLMLDSLAMFEAQLGRVLTSSSVPDLSRIANSVVNSASGLNTILREANAHALEAQIEAEVGDAAAQVDASEVWRQVGGEYRESVRVSDELVRSVTALMLGVGRLMREAVKERGTDSPDLGGGGSGRSSVDGGDRSLRPGRRSAEVDGRRSTEALMYRESRRSWEDTEGSVRRAAAARAELSSRPSTSLSMTRDRERDRGVAKDDGDETAREKDRSSALDRLSLRRIFTPRATHRSPASQDSPDLNYPSPSPAPRTSLDPDPTTRHRSLPPLAVPPPLPSLPSESQERKSTMGSTRRRAKFSNTSNATVRGTSIFPPVQSPAPTTAVSAHTVSAGGEMTAFPLVRAGTEGSSGGVVAGLQEWDGRKRGMSVSGSGEEGDDAPSRSPSIRALRSSKARMSLEGGTGREQPPPLPLPPANGDRRERRRTINELPS